MQNIIIRKAQIKDSVILSSIIKEIITDIPYYNTQAKENEIKKFSNFEIENKIKEDEFSIIVAILNNSIIGFCSSRFDDFTIWLEWIGVIKDFRGLGVSELLLQELEKTIPERKCHKIWCDTRTENIISQNMLSNNGYSKIATLKNHWYKQDFFLWEKLIN